MEKIYLFIILIFSTTLVSSQTDSIKREPLCEHPNEMPSFPRGEAEMMKFIQKNIQYPEVERQANIFGTCYVTFVVEKDGSLTGIKILRGVAGGGGCDKEAIRVIKLMPNWKAGKEDGKEVRVQFNLPIKFSLLSNVPDGRSNN